MTLLRNQLGQWVYPIHRIDRGTSGVLVFAKDPESARLLATAFEERRVRKNYFAVVRGIAPQNAEVDSPIVEEPNRPSLEAHTSFTRLAEIELPFAVGRYPTSRYSLVEARPRTGRRHQIRRHMVHLRHPLIGDVNYGDGKHNRFFREHFGVHRLLLHARSLTFPHPEGGELCVEAPLSEELARLFERLGWASQI